MELCDLERLMDNLCPAQVFEWGLFYKSIDKVNLGLYYYQ
ncbi:hypothetical protein SAMN04487786_1072 [Paenisporosarcina quisquiliarum]|nr:hypothetical protein SAMN04487786_1072 [Paenisporosarcina quisquiliarum]